MYGYGYPVYCCQGNNDGFGNGSSWIWAIILVVIIIFFLCSGNGFTNNQGCCR